MFQAETLSWYFSGTGDPCGANSNATYGANPVVKQTIKKYGFVDVKEKQKLEKPMRTGELETTVDPKAEWNQMFADAFRFQRDFFYDKGMHVVDWAEMKTRYGKLRMKLSENGSYAPEYEDCRTLARAAVGRPRPHGAPHAEPHAPLEGEPRLRQPPAQVKGMDSTRIDGLQLLACGYQPPNPL
mgnify:CR=1 FL=1